MIIRIANDRVYKDIIEIETNSMKVTREKLTSRDGILGSFIRTHDGLWGFFREKDDMFWFSRNRKFLLNSSFSSKVDIIDDNTARYSIYIDKKLTDSCTYDRVDPAEYFFYGDEESTDLFMEFSKKFPYIDLA